MIVDQNQVYLCGQCNWHKLWDPGKNPYTNLSLRLDIDAGESMFVDVPIKEKQIKGKLLEITTKRLAAGGSFVVLSGSIVQKKSKDTVKNIVRASLNTLSVQVGARAPLNFALVSGKVIAVSEGMFTLSVGYRNPLEGTTLERHIDVVHTLKKQQVEKLAGAFKVIVTGRASPKLPSGHETVNVVATSVFPEFNV